MQEQSHIQIFLSYAKPDKERVLQVYDFLINNGYPNTWIDCKKLLPGQPWEFEIQRYLSKSEIVIIFLSHTSVNKRGFVQREVKSSLKFLEEKLSSDIYIIPIKLDSDVEIPEELSKIQWLDFDLPEALELLKKSLDTQTEMLGFEVPTSVKSRDQIHILKKLITEKWEGLPGYEVELSIPVLNSTNYNNINEITKIIEAKYIRSLQILRINKIEQIPNLFSWAQFYYQRTNTYDAHYKSVFQKNNFLSIVYIVSWYGAGAAHPNYHFETFNFLLTPLFEIDDITKLFKNPQKSFVHIQEYLRNELINIPQEIDENGKAIGEDKLLDVKWVKSGTEDWHSFSAYAFSEDGIVIYFPLYQIGSRAVGSHKITIPYDLFYRDLKFDFRHALELPTYD